METWGWPTLQPLLCLAWLAATLPIVAAALPIPEAALAHRLLSVFAARGKTLRPSSSSSSWPSSKAKFTVPQKYFLHFYVVGGVVTTSLLLAIWFYAYMKMTPFSLEPSSYSTIASHLVGSNSFSFGRVRSRTMRHKYRVWRTVFVLLMMEIQVLRRLYETEHVFHYSPTARMHIVGYLAGIFFYVAAPVSLASSCIPETVDYLKGQIAEFIVKGRARMPDLVIDTSSLLKPLLKLGWFQCIGGVLFVWGSLHQIRCHTILGSLREDKDSDEYVIPCGDWFSSVSCPHYLAELVIYLGMLIASGGSDIPVWFQFVFVVCLTVTFYPIGIRISATCDYCILPLFFHFGRLNCLWCRLRTCPLQPFKLINGTFKSLKTTLVLVMPSFHLYYSIYKMAQLTRAFPVCGRQMKYTRMLWPGCTSLACNRCSCKSYSRG